jgi:hypothetical protein
VSKHVAEQLLMRGLQEVPGSELAKLERIQHELELELGFEV